MTTILPKPTILIAVDVIVIAVTCWTLQVLLVQRSDIKKESWVLPGWFVGQKETLLQAAKRKLQEETWYNKFTIHDIWIFDAVTRDPRARVISAWFLAVTNKTLFPFKDWYHTSNAQFFPIHTLPYLLFDHKKIIASAVKKLQELIMHTNIAKELLPKEFTLTDLQKTYEQILWKELNVRNFRNKVVEDWLIKPTWNIQIGVWHRPAQYFSFIL